MLCVVSVIDTNVGGTPFMRGHSIMSVCMRYTTPLKPALYRKTGALLTYCLCNVYAVCRLASNSGMVQYRSVPSKINGARPFQGVCGLRV